MTKHTAGPWSVDDDKKCRCLMVVADKGGMPGLIVNETGRKATPTDYANARLIAAAPEMLEALKAATQSLRTFRNVPKKEQEWTSFDDDVLDALFVVIAKAEGGET